MDYIAVFGARRQLNGRKCPQPTLSGFSVARWNAELSVDYSSFAIDIELKHGASKTPLIVRLTLPGRWHDDGPDRIWRFDNRLPAQVPAAFKIGPRKLVDTANTFVVSLGLVDVAARDIIVAVYGGEPYFCMPEPQSAPTWAQVPLQFAVTGADGVSLQLGATVELVLGRRSLRVRALYLPRAGGAVPSSDWYVTRDDLTLPFGAVAATELIFMTADDAYRPMSLDVGEDGPGVGASASHHWLSLLLARQRVDAALVLSKLALIRSQDTLEQCEFSIHGLTAGTGSSIAMRITEIPLRVRLRSTKRGGTVVHAIGERNPTPAMLHWPFPDYRVLHGFPEGLSLQLEDGIDEVELSSQVFASTETSAHVEKACTAGGVLLSLGWRDGFTLRAPKPVLLSSDPNNAWGQLRQTDAFSFISDTLTANLTLPLSNVTRTGLVKEERADWRRRFEALTRTLLLDQRNFDAPTYSREGVHDFLPNAGSPVRAASVLVWPQEMPSLKVVLEAHSEAKGVQRLRASAQLARATVLRAVAPTVAKDDYWLIFDRDAFSDDGDSTPIALEKNHSFLLRIKELHWVNPEYESKKWPIALFKRTPNLTVEKILDQERVDPTFKKLVADLWNPTLMPTEWTGVVLFGPRIEVNPDPANPISLLVAGTIPFRFVALSAQVGPDLPAVSLARVSFSAPTPPEDWDSRVEEGFCYLKELDVLIKDEYIVRASANALVYLRSLLGVELTRVAGQPPALNLIGSLDRDTASLRLRAVASVEKPLKIPDAITRSDWWPIQALTITAAEVETQVIDGNPRIAIILSGVVLLKKEFWYFQFPEQKPIKFERLTLVAGSASESPVAKIQLVEGTRLTILYRGLRFIVEATQPRFLDSKVATLRLVGMHLRFGAAAGLLGGLSANEDQWLESLVPLDGGKPADGFIGFEFALYWLDRSVFHAAGDAPVELRFAVVLPTKADGTPDFAKRYIGARAISLDLFSLSLFRFLTLKVNRLSIISHYGKPWIVLEGAHIDSAWGSLFDPANGSASAAICLNGSGRGGFVAVWSSTRQRDSGVNWALIGKNIVVDPQLQIELLKPGAGGTSGDTGRTLLRLFQDRAFHPANGEPNLGEWTTGIGISALPWVSAKLVFQEHGVAGLSITGGILEPIAQGLSLAYVPGQSAAQDRFVVAVAVPQFSIAGFMLTGATISVEVQPDGDFLVDIGFPWPLAAGGRDWERTVGMLIAVGQASGGVYVRRDSLTTGLQQVSVGVAIQWGVGVAINFGVIRGFARLGWFAILEGTAEVDGLQIHVRRFAGAGGVVAQVVVEISVWIVTARFSATASAEIGITAERIAALALAGQATLPAPQSSLVPINRSSATVTAGSMKLQLRFELAFRARFSVTVNLGLTSVRRSFEVGFAVPVSTEVIL